MLKRPSSRRKSSQIAPVQLNLVPILDTLVTLIAFLLFSMSFLSLGSIESPFPQSSAQVTQDKMKDKPLQLTLSLRDRDAEIWSPFDRIAPKRIPNLTESENSPAGPDVAAIHQALIEVKQKFPQETQIVLVPQPGSAYDTLIAVMDAARGMEATDPPLFVKNPQTGIDEPVKTLFHDIVFGNLLGGGG